MPQINIEKGRIKGFFLGRRLKSLSTMLALIATLSTGVGKAQAHELDLSGYFNKATVTALTGKIQKEEKDKYNTFMEKLTLARNIIKTVYETEKFDIDKLKKTMNQIDQLIDYLENMQEDYEELDLSDLIKDLNRIKEILTDNLITAALTYSKTAKAEIISEVHMFLANHDSFNAMKAKIVKNRNYATTVLILRIFDDIGIEDARLKEAEADIARIDIIFAAKEGTMSTVVSEAFK